MPNSNFEEEARKDREFIPFKKYQEIGPIERRLAMDEWLRAFLYADPTAPRSEILKLEYRIEVLQARLGALTL
jgi:hypothetical protein